MGALGLQVASHGRGGRGGRGGCAGGLTRSKGGGGGGGGEEDEKDHIEGRHLERAEHCSQRHPERDYRPAMAAAAAAAATAASTAAREPTPQFTPQFTAKVSAIVQVSMYALSLRLNQELEPSSSEGMSQAVLCALVVHGLTIRTSLRRDSTLQMAGTMTHFFAHDQRSRPNVPSEAAEPPEPHSPGLPMLSVEQRATDAQPAVQFQYQRFYSDRKRPEGGEIAFEAELGIQLESPRIVWLQQWIAGAFDYMDNSILAAVVRGVSDLSIARVWVPPNRFRPMRLRLQIASPVILVPRNVYALTDERQLAEHSLRVDLSTVTSDGVLVRKTLPGHEELGPLLCEELTIVFRGLLTTQPGLGKNCVNSC
jgi:hypothetical protein